jgi:hypothetical protein
MKTLALERRRRRSSASSMAGPSVTGCYGPPVGGVQLPGPQQVTTWSARSAQTLG